MLCGIITSKPNHLVPFHQGIYPEDVLLHYGAKVYGVGGPPVLGTRSPRNSFNPEADGFLRERGSYQTPIPAP